MTAEFDVSVVIVSWNTEAYLAGAVERARVAGQGMSVEVIVVDNDSSDGSAILARGLPDLKVVVLEENVGFTRAANLGAALAKGHYLLFLNPDVSMPPGSMSELRQSLDRQPRAWAVTPTFLNVDGTPQPFWSRRPGPLSLFCCFTHRGRAIDRRLLGGRVGRRHHYADLGIPAKPVLIDGAGAACLLCPTDVFRSVGGFDERFFNFFQDTDLFRRQGRSGQRLLGAGQVRVGHHRGVTFARLDPVEAHGRFLRDLGLYARDEPLVGRLAAGAAIRLELLGPRRRALRRWVRAEEVEPPRLDGSPTARPGPGRS